MGATSTILRRSPAPGPRPALRLFAAAGILALAFHVAHGQLGLGGHALDTFTSDWLYDLIVAGSAASCLARAWLVGEDRLPWLLLGVGLAFDAAGEVYYSLAFGESANPPIPSLADVLYLLYYPFAYTAILLFVRRRMHRFSRSTWLDGAIAAATAAAVISAIAFEQILHGASHMSGAALATTIAYPIGDMILLAIVICVFALSGWRPGRAWLLLGIGLVLWVIADTGYAYSNANGTYAVGDWLDSLWLASALATGAAAWQPTQPFKARIEGLRLLLFPSLFAITALGVLLYGGFRHVSAVGLALAGTAVLLVIARVVWTVHENAVLLENLEHEAVTDALTGLGNRRNLQEALARAVGSPQTSAVFVMFDLDDFKSYNDRFGHVAGDTLLAHLGRRLRTAVAGAGGAFRPGGDEFCVLLHVEPADADMYIAAAQTALSATGEGFSVTPSFGKVTLPREADTPTLALRVADDRMYSHKRARNGSSSHQTHDVLLGLMRERQPELHDHLCEVGRLAAATGRRLGMDGEKIDELRRAAELHDIGKAAIPDAILSKPGPLTSEEWSFMHRHTVVGERILAAAPALTPVAALVRSSHERWDGTGYPDGRRGDEIPLGARVVFVCDAYDAMTSDRPHSPARTPREAIAEIRRSAGTQFDPQVVDAFIEAWHEDGEPRRRTHPPRLRPGRIGYEPNASRAARIPSADRAR